MGTRGRALTLCPGLPPSPQDCESHNGHPRYAPDLLMEALGVAHEAGGKGKVRCDWVLWPRLFLCAHMYRAQSRVYAWLSCQTACCTRKLRCLFAGAGGRGQRVHCCDQRRRRAQGSGGTGKGWRRLDNWVGVKGLLAG